MEIYVSFVEFIVSPANKSNVVLLPLFSLRLLCVYRIPVSFIFFYTSSQDIEETDLYIYQL